MQLCTIPLDVAKVRLQLQKRAAAADGAGQSKYRGLMGTITTIAREEGLPALWKGVIAGLHRQCIYGGLRIGLYDPVSAVFLQIDGYLYDYSLLFIWYTNYELCTRQVKLYLVGNNFVGDIPLYQKILAALFTGR